MKLKIAITVILVVMVFGYVWLKKSAPEVSEQLPSFEGISEYSTGGWRDTVLDRTMLRFDAERKLSLEEMYTFSEYARKYAKNPMFTVLFYLDGIKSPYARIDYPRGIATELTGFERSSVH